MRKFLILATFVMLLSFGITYAMADQEEGLAVKNWKGEFIGSVKHVLTEPSGGNIVFVVLSLGREGMKDIAVPVKSFSSYDYENGYLVLNVSKEILAAAPEFRVSDLKDPAFVERVFRFFGLAPSWKDGTGEERGS
ncbi:MAG: PRC-barrel domain-containing protein [Thermodesulfobacteriota bacterium]